MNGNYFLYFYKLKKFICQKKNKEIVDRRLMILDLWKSLCSAVLYKNGKIP